MHTSDVVTINHFAYERIEGSAATPATFADLFPDYHPQDRVAVVAPQSDIAVTATGPALLALTTAYYESLRAQGHSFFNYPQHFCILDHNHTGFAASIGRVNSSLDDFCRPWSNLDVWPSHKWLHNDGSVQAMLKSLYDLQINRVFWPNGFADAEAKPSLIAVARDIMGSQLKQVMYYDGQTINGRIIAQEAASELCGHSNRLAGSTGSDQCVSKIEEIAVSAFLDSHHNHFEASTVHA